MGEEYLFERFRIPSGEWVRWAFLTENGFVRSREYTGPTRRGGAVIDPRRRGSARESGSGYYIGFSQRPESAPVASERRSAPAPAPRSGLAAIVSDAEVRKVSSILLRSQPVHDGGWSVREVLEMALRPVEDAERAAAERKRDLETRLVYANRSIDAWLEHSERHVRPPAVAPPAESYDIRPRPLPTASRYTDPYDQEAKRSRYEYDEREPEAYQKVCDPRHPTPSGAGPSTPSMLEVLNDDAWDVWRVSQVTSGLKGAQCALVRDCQGAYQIPRPMRSDRAFVKDPNAAGFIAAASSFLFHDGNAVPMSPNPFVD